MCGICGVFGKEDKNLIRKMVHMIEHRGPDGKGFFLDNHISLGVVRLSIIDSFNAHQPMFNEEGNICVIFDGEIYNHKELRDDLQQKGHIFKTYSDTEVIIHAFKEYGETFVSFLQGMFALSVWDGNTLFLYRDRMGIKPLFFTYLDDDNLFLFGSEIKPILQYDFQRTINTNALCQKTVLRYLLGNATLFNEIKQLPPGHVLTVTYNKNSERIILKLKEYATFNMRPNHNRSKAQTISLLKNLLFNSIKCHQVSDLPIGVFLSGGVDSSLIVGILSKLSDTSIKTFTFADDENHPDCLYARAVSEYFNTDHKEIIMKSNDVINELPEITLTSEGLFEGFSFFMFSREIRRNLENIKTVLCGEGADELFGGYWYYENMEYYKNRLYQRVNNLDIKHRKSVLNHLNSLFSNGLDNFFLYNLKDQLMNSHLLFIDHNAMAFGLEIRVPYLYDPIVRFVNTIPSNLKINDGIRKYVLREVAGEVLGEKLTKILTRNKIGAPSAIVNMTEMLDEMASRLIRDSYRKKHPYNNFLNNKTDLLRFDLFEYLFIENNGKLPKNFSISDLY